MHLNGRGQHKLYRSMPTSFPGNEVGSMRGAVRKCLGLLDNISVPNFSCKSMVP